MAHSAIPVGTYPRSQIPRSDGEPGGARTRDHRIKSAMLYQLSYRLNLLTTKLLTSLLKVWRHCLAQNTLFRQ
jgi:hypothetical protein